MKESRQTRHACVQYVFPFVNDGLLSANRGRVVEVVASDESLLKAASLRRPGAEKRFYCHPCSGKVAQFRRTQLKRRRSPLPDAILAIELGASCKRGMRRAARMSANQQAAHLI